MGKIGIVFCMLFFISCSGPSFTKDELIGTYVGNKRVGGDSIILLETSKYVHIGIRKCDNTRYADTGYWELYDKGRTVIFDEFITHNLKDASIDTVSGSWFAEIFFKKKKICLNVSTDQALYYIKQ